ncbi:hypothetical protein ACHAXR_013165 [Thalassiosira sp. AJA248-18]
MTDSMDICEPFYFHEDFPRPVKSGLKEEPSPNPRCISSESDVTSDLLNSYVTKSCGYFSDDYDISSTTHSLH